MVKCISLIVLPIHPNGETHTTSIEGITIEEEEEDNGLQKR